MVFTPHVLFRNVVKIELCISWWNVKFNNIKKKSQSEKCHNYMSSRFTANLPKRCKLIKSLSCYKLLQFRLNLKLLASSSIAQLSHRQAQLRENQKLKLHPISAPKTFLITYLGAEITLTPFYPSHRCQLHHPASLSTPLFKQSWNLKLSHLARISFFFQIPKPPPPPTISSLLLGEKTYKSIL